jgi:hypothetical protein
MIPLPLQKVMYGFIDSAVLFACHRLKLFQNIAGDDFLTAKELSVLTHCSEMRLQRLLNAACAIGLLEHRGAYGYRMCPEWRPYLTPVSEAYVGGFLDHMAMSTWPLAKFLDERVRDLNESPPSRLLFDEMYQHEAVREAFLEAMWNLGIESARELVVDSCLQETHRLVDIGGGPGSFSIAAAEHYPHLKATVFDLEQVRPHFEHRCLVSHARDRLMFVSGDFWNDALPSADVYALGYVLSDWGTSACLTLLRRVYEALPSGGHILLLEKLFDEGNRSPYTTSMLDISMMLETQGQHRSFSGYAQLLFAAGFVETTQRRSSGEKHLITACKP